MLYSLCVMLCEMNITLYQRTLLETSANQKRHYLKSSKYYKYYIIKIDKFVSRFISFNNTGTLFLKFGWLLAKNPVENISY